MLARQPQTGLALHGNDIDLLDGLVQTCPLWIMQHTHEMNQCLAHVEGSQFQTGYGPAAKYIVLIDCMFKQTCKKKLCHSVGYMVTWSVRDVRPRSRTD